MLQPIFLLTLSEKLVGAQAGGLPGTSRTGKEAYSDDRGQPPVAALFQSLPQENVLVCSGLS
jgi:hypothetical protein